MTTRTLLPVAVVAVVLMGANCRNAPEDRNSGPGDAVSTSERSSAQTPSGAGSGTGGATPSASRDSAGSTGNNPAQSREYAGSPGTTAQKPAPSAAAPTGVCETNEDCTLDRFIPGGCCQDCEERAVMRTDHDAQLVRCAAEMDKCPMRNCAPTKQLKRAACVSGTCQVVGKSTAD